MNSGREPRVAVIGTGETIAGIGRHSLDLYESVDFGWRQKVDARRCPAGTSSSGG
jgi:hypothetical protein